LLEDSHQYSLPYRASGLTGTLPDDAAGRTLAQVVDLLRWEKKA